jgi:flagellar biogenesis protein FliO
VAVVRAGERYFLLGLTQNEVSLISELDKAAVEAGTQTPPPGDSPFARILRRATGQNKEAGS